MSNKFPEIKDFAGLFLQANSFTVPDGAMEIARNVEIQNDATITKTRGWYTYWLPGNDACKALFLYQGKLIAAGDFGMRWFLDSTSIDQYTPVGTPFTLSGDAVSFGYTSRSAEQNKNLYFTSGKGIMKLESYSGKIRRSGVPPGLDLRGRAGNSAVGPLPPDSQTGFRIVFGRRDTNGNLLLGAPSDVAYIGIPVDGTGLTYTRSGAGPWTVTVTLPTNSGWFTGQQIIVSNGTSANVNGTQTISVVPLSASNISFSVASDPGASGTLDLTFARDAYFEASIPSEIDDVTDGWFYQVYRSSSSVGLDVSPEPDFKLSAEVYLTSVDISVGYVTFTDDTDALFLGAQLYTNPNTREGELQANARPPLAEDLCLYKGYMLYAGITTRQRLTLQMISASNMAGNSLKFRVNVTDETYVAKTVGVGNKTVSATSVSGTGTITITYASHGASNGWTVDLISVTGSVPLGTYTISGVTANTFAISSPGNSASAIDFSFVSDGTNAVFFCDITTSSIAVEIETTASYLVKAINRSSSILYANYDSTFDENPGQIRLESKGFLNFPIYVALAFDSQPFITVLPTSFSSGQQVYFDSDDDPNSIAVSKVSEPDAVPILQTLPAGSKNAAIKRIFTLRDSVVILKEDGAFKLSGDTIDQFQITEIDSTVKFQSSMGADKINNLVYALANQGVVAISETSVRIVSRRIDDAIQPVVSGLTSASVESSCLFGFETARTLFVSIAGDINTREHVTYLYNVLNEKWFETDRVFRNFVIGPNDVAYAVLGDEENIVIRQRKTRLTLDYADEVIQAEAISTGERTLNLILSATASALFTPAAGDVILYDEQVNRIQSISMGLYGFEVTTQTPHNIPASYADVLVYERIRSVMRFAPFHAGMVGLDKFFSQIQVHMRQPVITNLSIKFGTSGYASSEETDWSRVTLTGQSPGWGFEPWGLFPWGLSENAEANFGTYPSWIIRTLVPMYACRSTFIQPHFEHEEACEPLMIQALAFDVRGYGERVSR